METIVVEALVVGVKELLTAFKQNPTGATVVTGLLVYALACWVAVTWLKHRRG